MSLKFNVTLERHVDSNVLTYTSLIPLKERNMLKKVALKTAVLGFALFLAGICPALLAQTPSITAYSESHIRTDGADSADKKQSWQTIDLDAAPTGGGSVLGWRQWGGHFLETDLVRYDGSQGAASGVGLNGLSDFLGYDPANTYVSKDSYFFVTYKDPKTGTEIKDSRNFVYAFDSLTFNVPAEAKSRILRLWTGAYACDGEMDVDLLSSSGDILTSFSKTMAGPVPNADFSNSYVYGYWRFRFHGTGPNQTLRLRWHGLHRLQNNANLSLQAAVLTTVPQESVVH